MLNIAGGRFISSPIFLNKNATAKNIKRLVKSRIRYFSILYPNKIIKVSSKHGVIKKLKTEIRYIGEKKIIVKTI